MYIPECNPKEKMWKIYPFSPTSCSYSSKGFWVLGVCRGVGLYIFLGFVLSYTIGSYNNQLWSFIFTLLTSVYLDILYSCKQERLRPFCRLLSYAKQYQCSVGLYFSISSQSLCKHLAIKNVHIIIALIAFMKLLINNNIPY